MMNVKKYRAASTREALEKIKNELGENALVLETRQVRAGGFLGFGAGTQIEISAAVPGEPKSKKEKPVHSNRILNLTDDTVAAPFPKKATVDSRSNLMAALSARTNAPVAEPLHAELLTANAATVETVEISTEAPKVVHARKEFVRAPEKESANDAAGRELELLRAELREIKFSMNSFAGRQTVGTWPKEAQLDLVDEIFESPFYETFMELTETGISNELARTIIAEIIPIYRDRDIRADQLPNVALFRMISEKIRFVDDAVTSKDTNVLAIIGPTGVGKTTTIAKLAARAALKERRRVELVTLDTYRIAAVEQLKTYAEIIGAGCHVVRSVLELDALLAKLPDDALVLIDTTGKNPHDLADQYELSDYLRQRSGIRKCLAVQATTHPVDAVAAIRKFEMYGADSLVLTKIDETLRPGALLEIVLESALPVAYLSHGQRVPEDLLTATPETMTNRILGRQ